MLNPEHPSLAGFTTPALVIDRALLDANIARMASSARKAGVALRPHAKTHKCVEIGRRQMAAGAIGISCATLAEAENLAKAGLGGVLLTSPVVGAANLRRLAELHRHSPIMTVVDHPSQVDGVASLLASDLPPMSILIDVDVGQCRTGVVGIDDGVALAKRIRGLGGLQFSGLQAFAGHIQHIVEPEARRNAAEHVISLVRALRDRLAAEGLPPTIVSGSGTGASALDLDSQIFSELQVGSYVFMDADYGRLRDQRGQGLPYDRSLFVLATVISANRAGQVTVDAGTKALAVNGPLPDCIIGVPFGSTYCFAGDEHGILTLPQGADAPKLGTRVLIGATHCDPTVNLYGRYVAVSEEGDVERWAVIGRYSAATESGAH